MGKRHIDGLTARHHPSPMTDKLREFLKAVEPWKVVGGLIVGLAVGIYGAAAWIQREAQHAVLDERFLASLAARVRPACIFDSRGTIEADFGASEYVEDIQVLPAPKAYGFEVLIHARRHLAYAPLVTGLDVGLFPATATRGRLHDWRIVLAPNSTTHGIITQEGMDTNAVYRFRLEILH